MRPVAVLWIVATSACASWGQLPPAELGAVGNAASLPSPEVLVVTSERAYELRVLEYDPQTIHGTVLHAWTLPAAPPVSLPGGGDPEIVAQRLGWQEVVSMKEMIAIPRDQVVALAQYDPHETATNTCITTAIVGGVVLGVAALLLHAAPYD